MSLPFELYEYHKPTMRWLWKKDGLKVTEEEFQSIYYMYIYTSHCELCNKEFKSVYDRHMEHNHETGEFRNIVCNSCNLMKYDVKIRKNNTSGYPGICKHKKKKSKQGFTWIFQANINGKQKKIKSSVNYDWLVEFAIKWKIDNNYHT